MLESNHRVGDPAGINLQLLKKGDEVEWHNFYDQHRPALVRFCSHYADSLDDAEEWAQEVLIKCHENIEQLDENRSIKAWIYKVARNLCLNHLKRRKIGKKVNAWNWSKSFFATSTRVHIVDHRYEPDVEVEKLEKRKLLEDALDSLSEDHRTVILLKYSEGLSRKEISTVLGIEENTIKSRLYHAVRALKNKPLNADNFF